MIEKVVSFDLIQNIPVKHWQKCETKEVNLPLFEGNKRWHSFQLSIKSKFIVEIGELTFRLYMLPYKFTNISQRKYIDTVEMFEIFLNLFQNIDEQPSLYVWNVENDEKTPTKPPMRAMSEAISKTSRNTTQSLKCKIRDGNVCIFCGYTDSSKRDACHILELRDMPKKSPKGEIMKSEEELTRESDALLELCGLEGIHSLCNMISLCKKCHSEFDYQNLRIEPSSKCLLVDDEIFSKTTQGGIYFETLNGKVIEFQGIKTQHPTFAVLNYRFKKSTSIEAIEKIAEELKDLDLEDEEK